MTGDATPAVDKGVMTVAQVAEVLDCSESTVRRLAAEQGLPALRHGTWMRIPRHALNQWISRTAAAVKPPRRGGPARQAPSADGPGGHSFQPAPAGQSQALGRAINAEGAGHQT